MDPFKENGVHEYIISLHSTNQVANVNESGLYICECPKRSGEIHAHGQTVVAFRDDLNLFRRIDDQIKNVPKFVTKHVYFNGKIMKFLCGVMLANRDIEVVESLYATLYKNFKVHPCCAPYMIIEYEHLFLRPYGHPYMDGLTIWNYILSCVERMNSAVRREMSETDPGSPDAKKPPGHKVKKSTEYISIKLCFYFLVNILRAEYEIAIKKNVVPLITKCINYTEGDKTRMDFVVKILDSSFSVMSDFQEPFMNLLILITSVK